MNISLENIKFSYKDEIIVDELSAIISEQDRIGLIGENGSGKTTLLNIITGKLSVDSGDVFKRRGLTIGFLEQNSGLQSEFTVLGEMRTCFSSLIKMEERMRAIEIDMGTHHNDKEQYDRLSNEYNNLKRTFEGLDGYNIDVKIKTVLNGLGFKDLYDRQIQTFSGGEKTRLAIAKLLLQNPDLLILDEPTNHLDFQTLSWLETYLKTYKGALLIVSHDRFFLDRTVEKIWELDDKKINLFKGNYTKYKRLKKEWYEATVKEYEKQQVEIAKMEDYVARNLTRASTAKSAQSRVKKLDSLDRIKKPKIDKKHPVFKFDKGIDPTKEVVAVNDLTLYAGDKLLFEHGTFTHYRNEKVAIVGENGRGKSTLLRHILSVYGKEEPNVVFGKNLLISYYDQENLNLNFDNTVIDEMWDKYPRSDLFHIRQNLGRMLFEGEDLDKKVGVLSGGERARLGFSIMMMAESNFMIMDEPTNHIDLQTRESLEDALIDYEGSILFVSHDRYFLEQVATKIIEIGDDGISTFNMRFDEYLEVVKERQSEIVQTVSATKEKKTDYKNAKERKEIVKLKLRLKEVEKLMTELEEKKEVLNGELASEEVGKNYQLLMQKTAELDNLDVKLEELFVEWEEISIKVEE